MTPKARFEQLTNENVIGEVDGVGVSAVLRIARAAFLAGAVARDEAVGFNLWQGIGLEHGRERRRAIRRAAGKVWEGR